jgi:two-component system sensor histidine kinase ChvG
VKQRVLRFLSRIWIRLLAFNVLLVFLPIAALWSLENTEKYLLDLQESSNVQQGRLLAAALGDRGPLGASEAQRIIRNLQQRVDARLRVVDSDRNVLADSSRFGPKAQVAEAEDESESGSKPEVRDTWLYRLGSGIYRLYSRAFVPPREPSPSELSGDDKIDGKEIREALAGSYGKDRRLSSDRTALILYSAIPIRDGAEVVGVALVSKSTSSVLNRLYALRFQAFEVVLISVGVAIVLSLLVSTTIARPVSRLRNQALAILDRRGRLRGRFKVSRSRDEIGDLSRALHELTRRLEEHIAFIEGFASDVSHEFRNPLASIRSAADLLAEVDDGAERRRFHAMVLGDLSRLERLLSGVREITRIDAEIDAEPTEPVRLDELLRGLVAQFSLRHDGPRYRLDAGDAPVTVRAPPHRVAQVFENLLDNARGFSPAGGEVRCTLEVDGGRAVARVADQGPGIPEEHLHRIFQRFFTYRPEGAENGCHTGLGLAIVKAIVEGAGGEVRARNGRQGGAVFEVELPLAN